MEPIAPPFLPPDMPYLRLNDALVFGDWPDNPTILDRPIMTNIAACKATLLWQPVPATVRGLFEHYSHHVESFRKDGMIMFPGTLDETRSRRCDNVLAFDLVVYDFDGTMSVSEAWTCALNSGRTFAMYSSPSHLLEGIEKFRLAFPLDETFVLKESDLLRRKEEWLVRYKHVADTFGFAIDKTGGDLNRAFNSPRHRPNAPYFTWIVGGSALQLPDIELPAHRKPTRKKKAEPAEGLFFDDPELVPGYDDDAGEEHEALNIDKALRKRVGEFIRSRGNRFAVADFIESIGWNTVSQEQDKITIPCPNRDQHSDPEQENDTACAALNPDASPKGRAAITCLHAHCRHLSTSDLLTMMLEQIELDNPIELMREHVQEPMMSKKNPKQRTKKPKEEVDRPEPKEEVDQPEWLPDGFTVDEDGIYREDEFVCGPFEAVAMLRDENSNKWSLLIEFMDPDSVMKSVPVDRSRLHGDLRALKAELAGHGLKITVGFDFDSLFNNIKVDGRLRCADKPGFVGDDVFVTPWGDSIVKDDRSEHGFLAPEKRLTNQTAGTAEGQIAAFQAAFDEAFSTGADHFAVAALAGSAGCVVDYLKLDSTPLLSLTGPSTGGKTTANRIAASAGGNPREDEGLLHTLQAASTGGIELLASRANGTFLGLDEPSTASERLLGDLEKMVFMLASGGGSKRMNRSASTFRPVMKWRTFGMITSELKVSTILQRLGKTPKTGFNVRLIELDISQEPRVDEGPFDKIMACMQHYGHIIPLIAEHLLCRETREGLQKRLAEMTDKLAGDKASPTQHRSASILALLWVVGDLYKATGVARADHDFELVIRRLWARYLESPEARALDPVEAAADKLREALLSRRNYDVAPISAHDDDSYRSREPVAWYRAENNDKHITFYVPVKNLEALSGGIVNARMLGSLLRKQGILQVLGNADTSKDNAHKAIPSVGDIRHYRLVYPAPAKSDLPATNLVDAAEFAKRRAVMSAAA